jgi:hypothetical protein
VSRGGGGAEGGDRAVYATGGPKLGSREDRGPAGATHLRSSVD